MDAILAESTFVDFGVDPLYPFAPAKLCRVDGQTPEQLRGDVRKLVPRVPGVYGMLDALGRLIYVGKSKCLRNRLLSYFLPNNEEDKAGRIVQATMSIVWENQPSEFAALLREQALIRSFQPRFNVQGIPRRQQPVFVCLGRAPAEQLYTARQHDPRALSVIGPLFGAARASRAVEVLNRVFKLRDCSSKQQCGFTEQLQLFEIEMRPGCIRLEIDSCLGPCISACSRSSYAAHVEKARSFLSGSDIQGPLEHIKDAMLKAAKNQHFEQAIVLREDLRAITWLSRRASDMANARETYTFVYPVASFSHPTTTSTGLPNSQHLPPGDVWYLIRRGIIEGAVPAPATEADKRRTRSMLKHWLENENHVGAAFSPRPESLALVSSWFRNNRAELKQTFVPGQSRAPASRRKALAAG